MFFGKAPTPNDDKYFSKDKNVSIFVFVFGKKKGLHKRSRPSDLDESDQTLDNVITMIEAMVYQLQRVQGTSKGAHSAL